MPDGIISGTKEGEAEMAAAKQAGTFDQQKAANAAMKQSNYPQLKGDVPLVSPGPRPFPMGRPADVPGAGVVAGAPPVARRPALGSFGAGVASGMGFAGGAAPPQGLAPRTLPPAPGRIPNTMPGYGQPGATPRTDAWGRAMQPRMGTPWGGGRFPIR